MRKRSSLITMGVGCVLALGTVSCVEDFQSRCEADETMCSSGCADLLTDEQNCGTCGNACAPGETCEMGDCTPEGCAAGLTDCDGNCVNLDTDPDHCGSCDNVCGTDEVCNGGTCSADCYGGLTNCSGSCVDTATDEDHCGRCDSPCSTGEECVGGTCTTSTTCEDGLENCSGECVDLMTDAANCGECGFGCAEDQMCVEGDCVCEDGLALCGDVCAEDGDGDGQGGECDPCPLDNPDDSDDDGVCDSDDLCPGLDDGSSIANGGFSTADSWSPSSGAMVNTTASGALDVGEAFFTSSAVCDGAELLQTICVPGTYETLGPMVLALFARSEGCSDPFFCSGRGGVRFDGHFQQVGQYLSVEYGEERHMCLGEAAYGGTVDLALTALGGDATGTCEPAHTAGFAYDNLALATAPADLCPAPGTILNGDFEGGDVGWTFTGEGVIEDSGSGNMWARLSVDAGTCGATRMYGTISQPLRATVPNTALRLRAWGLPDWEFNIRLEGASKDDVLFFTGTGSWENLTFCLSQENEGVVHDIEVHVDFPGGTCATQPYRYLYVDDMAIVSSASSCP